MPFPKRLDFTHPLLAFKQKLRTGRALRIRSTKLTQMLNLLDQCKQDYSANVNTLIHGCLNYNSRGHRHNRKVHFSQQYCERFSAYVYVYVRMRKGMISYDILFILEYGGYNRLLFPSTLLLISSKDSISNLSLNLKDFNLK